MREHCCFATCASCASTIVAKRRTGCGLVSTLTCLRDADVVDDKDDDATDGAEVSDVDRVAVGTESPAAIGSEIDTDGGDSVAVAFLDGMLIVTRPAL